MSLPKPRSLARGIIAIKFKEKTTLSEDFEKAKAIGTKMSNQLILLDFNVCTNEDFKVISSSSLW